MWLHAAFVRSAECLQHFKTAKEKQKKNLPALCVVPYLYIVENEVHMLAVQNQHQSVIYAAAVFCCFQMNAHSYILFRYLKECYIMN